MPTTKATHSTEFTGLASLQGIRWLLAVGDSLGDLLLNFGVELGDVQHFPLREFAPIVSPLDFYRCF